MAISLLLLLLTTTHADLTTLFSSSPEDYHQEPLTLTKGSSPAWLQGALYRVGPGMFEYGDRSVNNLCDGLAKVHGWRFQEGGNVSYTGVMIESRALNLTRLRGRFYHIPVMGDVRPDYSLAEEVVMMTTDHQQGNADNTNIAIWNLDDGESITVCTESPLLNSMVPESLHYRKPLTQPGFSELSATDMAMFSASHFGKHPSGSSINYILHMSMLPWKMGELEYTFYDYTPIGAGHIATKKIGSIKAPFSDIRLIHQFGVTENFVVIPRWNNMFTFQSLTSVVYDMAHMCNVFKFNYDAPTYMDVMLISTGEVFSFELPPTRGVHITNSFERLNEKGELEIVLDAPVLTDVHSKDLNAHCMFDALKIPLLMDPETLYKEIPHDNTLRRYIMNLNTMEYRIESEPQLWKPVDSLVDFPMVNPDYMGRPYCYSYYQQWYFPNMTMSLIKYDSCTKTLLSWKEPALRIMEPIFAPNPKGTAEDDGVIVAPAYNEIHNKTELLVWNAKDLEVVTRYDNPVNVPFTIHGWWFKKK